MRTLFPIAVVLLILFALPGVVIFAADLAGYEAEINAWLENTFGVSHRVAVALPAALILFFIPPLIVLLYFLRLKRKPVPVSSTYLWKKSIEDLHVNRLMQWLRRNILLLLQLLAILTLIYAALGPRMHGTLTGGRYYIIVVDNSASMSATDVQPNRLAWAKQQALREIDAATDSDFGMVIAFNSTAEIRQSYTNNRAALKRAVEGIQLSQKPTRIDEALALAASLANPLRSTEDAAAAPPDPEPGKERTYVPTEGLLANVHLYSDGRFPPPDFALANLTLNLHTPPAPDEGGASNNLAVSRLDAERGWVDLGLPPEERDPADPDLSRDDPRRDDSTKLTVIGVVRNYRSAPVSDLTATLQMYEAGSNQPMKSYAKTIRNLLPRQQAQDRDRIVPFYLADVPENADLTFRLRLEKTDDIFPLDDEGWVCLGIVRKAKVLAFTPDNNFILRNFLDLPSTRRLADVAYLTPEAIADPRQYLSPAREGKYDLIIFDRCAPPAEDQMPTANTLFIGYPPPPFQPIGTDSPLAVTAANGPFIQGWDDKHPVMRNLSALYEVGIDEAFRLPDLPVGTRRLIEAERGHVLLAALPRGAFTDLVLTFPLLTADGSVNTRWPLYPSFVLFLRNVLFALGNVRDASVEDVTLPGQEKILRTGGAAKVRVRKPDGTVRELERGPRPDFAFTDTDQVGVYEVTWEDQGRRFAVNLFPEPDHDESDLAVAAEVKVGEQTIKAGEERKQPRDLWKYAVLAGLAVLLAEWWIYNKRVQV
jgi:hypothetical protein